MILNKWPTVHLVKDTSRLWQLNGLFVSVQSGTIQATVSVVTLYSSYQWVGHTFIVFNTSVRSLRPVISHDRLVSFFYSQHLLIIFSSFLYSAGSLREVIVLNLENIHKPLNPSQNPLRHHKKIIKKVQGEDLRGINYCMVKYASPKDLFTDASPLVSLWEFTVFMIDWNIICYVNKYENKSMML